MTTTTHTYAQSDVERAARLAVTEIVEDIRRGVYPADTTLNNFLTLHDFVDANMYAADELDQYHGEEMLDFANEVQDRVHLFLNRHPLLIVKEY